MKEYRIKDWDKHFENAASRKLDTLNWVPVPNKHDGEGYRTIIMEKDGIVMYGCWHLILQVASKCQPRGSLVRSDGTPHTAKSISIKTGCPDVDAIQRTLDFCASPEVAWIQCVTSGLPTDYQPTTNQLVSVQARREGNGIEGKEGKGIADPHAPIDAELLKTIPGAVDFIKLHPAFKKVPRYAIENVFKPYEPYRDKWPMMCRQFQTDHAGVDEMKYPPCQQLRIEFDRYIKFKNLPSPYQSN